MSELDSEDSPAFLAPVCEELGRRGGRFEVRGFFASDLPVAIEIDLHYLLEDLPGLIKFLLDGSQSTFTVGLWGQGIETEIDFARKNGDPSIEVTARSSIRRPSNQGSERIAFIELASQISEFVRAYETSIGQAFPQLSTHPWNQALFNLAKQLRAHLSC